MTSTISGQLCEIEPYRITNSGSSCRFGSSTDLNIDVEPLEIIVEKAALDARVHGSDIRVALAGFTEVDSALDAIWQGVSLGSIAHAKVRSEQFGVVALDGRGVPVHDALWADDERSADDAEWCNKKFPVQWWVERIGEVPRMEHGIAKLSWLHRSESESWNRIERICGVDDFVRWKLLGTPLECLVISNRTFTSMGFGLSEDFRVNSDVLQLLDGQRAWDDVIPPVVATGSVLGTRDGVEIAI